MAYCRDVMGYCRDVMGYCRDVMGQLKKSREKIQNRGAILNFFEFVRTGAPYAQQAPGPKSKTGSAGLCFGLGPGPCFGAGPWEGDAHPGPS